MAHINDASDRLAVYLTGGSTQQGLYELMWCEPYRNAPCPGVASIGLLVEAIARRHLVEQWIRSAAGSSSSAVRFVIGRAPARGPG